MQGRNHRPRGPDYRTNQRKADCTKVFLHGLPDEEQPGLPAIGFWAEQMSNEWRDDEPLTNYTVTIDELEELTGIDFFCNLPDNIENSVEDHFSVKAWGLE